MGLSKKEEKFCMEYAFDYNGTQAAIRAGYREASAANAAYRILKKPEARERVEEIQRDFNGRSLFASKERVLSELWDVYSAAVAAKPVTVWDRFKHEYVETGEYCFDGRTAAKCLELIGKMNGMFNADESGKLSGGFEVIFRESGDKDEKQGA